MDTEFLGEFPAARTEVPPGDCPVWALAEGFLGLTWTDPATNRPPTGIR